MKEKKELTCIGCPMGCLITVETDNGAIERMTGYTCPHGKAYAEKELTHPERTVTSTVPVDGGALRMLPVKTAGDIPKDRIFDSMACIHTLRVHAPVKAGDVVLENLAGTGINLVAARTIDIA